MAGMIQPGTRSYFLFAVGILISTGIIGWIDLETGYQLNFFVFYFLPVAIAAWRLGIEAAITASIICALIWALADWLSGNTYPSAVIAVWNTFIRLSAFLIISWAFHKIQQLYQSEASKNKRLEQALSEIKVLESIIPICCVCKKIRDDDTGKWQQIEQYISTQTDSQFSHGYCPDCAKRAMEEAGLGNARR